MNSEELSRSSNTPLTKQEKVRSLWAKVRKLNQELAAVHREIARVESDLPEPYGFGDDWVPPFLRSDGDVSGRGRRDR